MRVERGKKVRDVVVLAADDRHIAEIVEAVRALEGIEVEHVSDRTFLLHLGGKLEVVPRTPLKTREDLSMAYTPGVARVCSAIADDPDKVWNLTVKQHTVAVVTDGTAVLGLGDIGPEAALPVMEGKAVLFKEFGGIDAWPICLDTTDPDEIVARGQRDRAGLRRDQPRGHLRAALLRDRARLREILDIPVFHDDQHGTAIVVLAALLNALRVVGKRIEDVRVVFTGAGAAGNGHGADAARGRRDRHRLLRPPRRAPPRAPGLRRGEARARRETNPRDFRGLRRRGAGRRGRLHRPLRPRRRQRRGHPDDGRAADRLRDGEPEPGGRAGGDRGRRRSRRHRPLRLPEPDQQRARLPGRLPGALDVRASAITREMELAAAHALADVVDAEHLAADYVLPSVFDRTVAPAVAAAVSRAAEESGVARRRRTSTPAGA